MSLYARRTNKILGEGDWYRNVYGSSHAMHNGLGMMVEDKIDVKGFSGSLVQMWRDLTGESLPPRCPGDCGREAQKFNHRWIGAHIVLGGQTDPRPVRGSNQVFIIPTCQECNHKQYALHISRTVRLVQLIVYGLYAQEEYITWRHKKYGSEQYYSNIDYTIHDNPNYQQFLQEETGGEAQWNWDLTQALRDGDDGVKMLHSAPARRSRTSRHSGASTRTPRCDACISSSSDTESSDYSNDPTYVPSESSDYSD